MLKFIINVFFSAILINQIHTKAAAWSADFLFNQEDFTQATQEQRSKFMNAFGDLFKEMEKRTEFQVQLKEGTLKICTNAGWVDSVANKNTSCSFKQFEILCSAGKIKCADWTGVDRCVDIKSSSRSSQCLKNRSQAEVEKSHDYYISEYSQVSWNTKWIAITLFCRNWVDSKACKTLRENASKILESKSSNSKTSFLNGSNPSGTKFTFNSKLKTLLFLELFDHNRAYASACRYDEKNRIFEKKDGSKIKLSFASHHDPDLSNKTLALARNATQSNQLNSNSVHAAMDEILEDHSDVIKDIKNQISELKTGNFQWMGFEHTPGESNLVNQVLKEGDLVERLLEMNNYPSNKINDYKMLALGPATYAKLKVPKNSPMPVPMEDEVAKNIALRLIKIGSQKRNMIKIMEMTHIISEADSNIIYQAYDDSITKSEMASKKEGVKKVISKLNGEVKNLVQDFITHCDSFAESSHLREYHVALNAFKQNGNGIIFMGSAHEKGVSEFLTKVCNGLTVMPELPNLTKHGYFIVGASPADYKRAWRKATAITSKVISPNNITNSNNTPLPDSPLKQPVDEKSNPLQPILNSEQGSK